MQEVAFHVSYCVCFLLPTLSLITVPAKVISSLRSPEDEPACPLESQTQVLSHYHCFPYKTVAFRPWALPRRQGGAVGRRAGLGIWLTWALILLLPLIGCMTGSKGLHCSSFSFLISTYLIHIYIIIGRVYVCLANRNTFLLGTPSGLPWGYMT